MGLSGIKMAYQEKMSKEQQFRELISEHEDKIYRICSWYFTDTDERNDAYQEALIKIWEQLHSFKGKSKISTWLYRVTVNICLSGIRSNKRRLSHIDTDRKVESLEIPEATSETEGIKDKKLKFFQHFMETLGLADRTLVSLYLEDISTREMADITGLSEANVRVKIFRVKEQIKKQGEEQSNGIG